MRKNRFSEVAPNFMEYDGYDYDNTKSSDVDNYEGSFAQKFQKERSSGVKESKLSERIGPGLKRELELVKELVASGDCADESMVADTIMHCPEDFPNLFPLATNPKLYNRKFLPLIKPYVDMAFGMRTH